MPPSKQETLLLLILSGFLITLVSLRPVDDLDLFTQLSLGKLMLINKSLVSDEPFGFLIQDGHFSNNGWLAQFVFYLIFKVGSWPLLKIFYATLFALAFVVAAFSGLKNSKGSLAPVLCAVVMGALTVLSNTSIRPQIFSLLGLAFVLKLLKKEKITALNILFFIPLALLWQNAHTSLSIAAILISIFITSNIFECLKNGRKNFRYDLWVFLLITIVCQFVTPLGFEFAEISALNIQISRGVLGVSEWMSPWHASVSEAMQAFWIVFMLTVYLAARNVQKLKCEDFLIFLCFSCLTLYSARFSFYWGLVMVPVWIHWIAGIKIRCLPSLAIISTKFAYISFVIMLLTSIYLSYVIQIANGIPLNAASDLIKEKKPARIYNYREWGGILTFGSDTSTRIMLDGRLYLYPKDLWSNYIKEASGHSSLIEIEQKYSPEAFFLHKSYQSGLIKQIENSLNWEKHYDKEDCLVFVKAER